MNIWTILDIEPTTDKRAIKRAYGKMASRYHPEEQPEKFQEVYDAYEQAIAYAEWNDASLQQSEQKPILEDAFQEKPIHFDEMIPEAPRQRLTLEGKAKEKPVNFDETIPETPRHTFPLEGEAEEKPIHFDEMIPGTPRQTLTLKGSEEEHEIDFEKLVSSRQRKLTLQQQGGYTINFQSIVKDEASDDRRQDEPVKNDKKAGAKAKTSIICVIIFWLIMALIDIFSGESDFINMLRKRVDGHGRDRVKITLEEKYDTEFHVSSIDVPETMNRIYYLVDDGRKKEDYQWFTCWHNDGDLVVQFYAALDDSGGISYNYSYKELLEFIDYVGLGDYLDVSDIQKNNLEYMKKGEKRYCYPILKLSSGNLNKDFFGRLEQLSDMIQESRVQFENSEQITINIKNSGNGKVYNLHVTKGKKADMKAIRQELITFFER